MAEREMDTRIPTFIERLEKMDAGERARFKRDAGKTLAEASSIGLFYRLLPYGLKAWQEERYFLVATLYPLGKAGAVGNFGASLRRARNDKNKKGLDRRIEILLDSDTAQLPYRMRQAVKFLKSNEVPIHWEKLLLDVLRWDPNNKFVQKEWARAYFALPEMSDRDPATASANDARA